MILETNDCIINQDNSGYMSTESRLSSQNIDPNLPQETSCIDNTYKIQIDTHCNAINKEKVINEKHLEVSKQENVQNLATNKSGLSVSFPGISFKDENKNVATEARKAVAKAKGIKDRGFNGVLCGASIKLPNGKIISGTNSPLFHSATAVIIKACKFFVGLPANVELLSKIVIESIGKMKGITCQTDQACLNVRELLIALAVQSPLNPTISKIIELFPKFKGCEMHLTHIPTLGDQSGLKKLGINFTYDPISATQD